MIFYPFFGLSVVFNIILFLILLTIVETRKKENFVPEISIRSLLFNATKDALTHPSGNGKRGKNICGQQFQGR